MLYFLGSYAEAEKVASEFKKVFFQINRKEKKKRYKESVGFILIKSDSLFWLGKDRMRQKEQLKERFTPTADVKKDINGTDGGWGLKNVLI